MKYLPAFLLFLFLAQHIFGQVSGKLEDADGKPVTFASVTLLKKQDSIPVRASLSDEKGGFRLDGAGPGNYFVKVSIVGYQAWNSPVFELTVAAQQIELGTVLLIPSDKQLGEVTIRAGKPLVQQAPGGLVVNIQGSIMTKGSSVLEVLERSPGVTFDPSNNSLQLNGKSGVMIMMDGKLLRMSTTQLTALLNGMSADNIDKIELLNTPPAKYDADGNAGLINIVRKKNKKPGTNGSFTVTAGDGKGEKGSAGININHYTGKINFNGSYSYAHDRGYGNLLAGGTEVVSSIGGPTTFIYNGLGKPVSGNHHAELAIDFPLNHGVTIGSSVVYGFGVYQSHSNNHGQYALRPDSVLLFNSFIDGNTHSNDLTNSIYFEKEFSKKKKLRADADYIAYRNDGATDVQSSFVDNHGNPAGAGDSLYAPRQRDLANTLIQVGVAKADYTGQINSKWKLEAGVKGSYTRTSSVSGIDNLVNGTWVVSSVGTSSSLVTNEVIGAAYATVNVQIDSLNSLVAGARYEYSHNSTDKEANPLYAVDRRLGKLFPGIFYTRKLNDHSELQLSFTNRITRPSYSELASYITYNDPVSVFTGNPALKPTITHNLNIGYNYHRYLFSLLFSRDDNPILQTQISTGPSKGLVYLAPQNAAWQNNITFQATIPLKIAAWWNMNYNFTGGLHAYRIDYTPTAFEKTYFAGSLNVTETYKLPKQFTIEISGYYNTSSFYATSNVVGNGVLNAGIKKELADNKGSFQLSISDLLRSANFHSYIGNLTRDAFDTKAYVTYKPESSYVPVVKLTYYRSFGSTGNQSQKKGDNGTKEERDRL